MKKALNFGMLFREKNFEEIIEGAFEDIFQASSSSATTFIETISTPFYIFVE